jgi:hypothetical protein
MITCLDAITVIFGATVRMEHKLGRDLSEREFDWLMSEVLRQWTRPAHVTIH